MCCTPSVRRSTKSPWCICSGMAMSSRRSGCPVCTGVVVTAGYPLVVRVAATVVPRPQAPASPGRETSLRTRPLGKQVAHAAALASSDEPAVGHQELGKGTGAGGVEAGDIADLLVGQRTAHGGAEHGIDVRRIRG